MTTQNPGSGLEGYPENWQTMTREEKRNWRLNNFLDGKGIKFVSPEAKANYRIRAKRWVDAYDIKEPDMVPVSLPVGDLPFILYGINAHTAMYDIGKAIAACEQFNEKYAEELEYYASPATTPAKLLEILDLKFYVWPGHGLSQNAPGYQFVEGEYMKADEYDDLIRDPSDFWFRKYLPRIFGAFEAFHAFQPLTNIFEMPAAQAMTLGNPGVKEMLQNLLEASKEAESRREAVKKYATAGQANGYPLTRGGLSKAPFDILGDTLRGTSAIMKDIYRRPDKVLEAVDKIADVTIHNLLTAADIAQQTSIMFPLHKGADGWMSQKQFDTFYFPSLKRVIDAVINEGIIVTLFAEGAYNTRLEAVNVFPKGSVVWLFDQTDMVRAKKVLGSQVCLEGNVPSSLIVAGNPRDTEDYCRKLIQDCAPGGGFILAAGCTAENPKLENLRAMLAAAKEYGVYRK